MADGDTSTDSGTAMTVSEAASVFSSILAREDGQPVAEKPKKQVEASEPSDEEADASDEVDETPDEAEADEAEDEDGAAEEDGSEDEEDDAAPLPDTAKVTVEIDGKPQEVTVQELKSGYLRQADYTRKTQQLAEQRKTLEPEMHAVREERAHYAAILPALAQQLQELQKAQQPDMDRLWAEDPIEWVRQNALIEQREKRLVAVQQEQARLQQMAAREQQTALARHVEGQREELQKLVPEARDKAKWDALRPKIRDYATSIGFSEEEVRSTYDARAVAALVKAMRYDELMTNKPKPNVAKAPASAPSQAASTPTRKHTDLSKARMRLAKTGSVRDAASVFAKIPGLI
jgi:hypothetical protein